MQSRVTFYVNTADGGYVKLGSVKTVLDCSKPGVVEKVGKDLGVGGWNCYEVNGKMVEGGPGLKAADVLFFVKDDRAKVMSLKYQSVIGEPVVPHVDGYRYVVPVIDDEVTEEEEPVVEEEVEEDVVEEEEVGEAPSKSESLSESYILKSYTVAKLLELYPEFAGIKMSKADLVKAIVERLKV